MAAGEPAGGGAVVDVVAIGETMGQVATVGTGAFAVGTPVRLSFGGAESNVCVGLARLGHRAAWIGCLGADPIGRMIATALRGEGVDTSRVRFVTGVPTALMLREHRTADRVRVTYYRRDLAGSRLMPADVDAALVGSARVLHVTGITSALSAAARAATEHAVRVAAAAGVRVSFDLNYRGALWSRADAGAAVRGLAAAADVVFAGAEEADVLVGPGTPEQQLARLAELAHGEAVVKLGADGALAIGPGLAGPVHVPAHRVTAIDPVGAGDAFVAGYLSGLLDGVPVAARAERGAICGAFSVSVAGDWEGQPSRAELDLLSGLDNVAR